MKFIHIHEIGSTNSYGVDLATSSKITEDHAILADIQTSGRGRLNHRSWVSALGNFHCSYIMNLEKLGISEINPAYLGSKTSEILLNFLKYITGSDLLIKKHPNDILVNGKKLAGILIETIYPYAVIGIGINLAVSPVTDSANLRDEFDLHVGPKEVAAELYVRMLDSLKVETLPHNSPESKP
jgi:BirA family biotin operon repressor/biotin-[acetyl-CoA-carboxylase] ligase